MGLCFAMFVFLTFRGPLASHDSNPYPNRSRIARYNATKTETPGPGNSGNSFWGPPFGDWGGVSGGNDFWCWAVAEFPGGGIFDQLLAPPRLPMTVTCTKP